MASGAYCINCKENREFVNFQIIVTDSGRHRKIGECPVCGTAMARILGRAV